MSRKQAQAFAKRILRRSTAGRPFQADFIEQSRRDREFLIALSQDLSEHPDHVLTDLSERAGEKPRSAVFLVHGHDEANTMRLADLLRSRWSLEVVVLQREAQKGRVLLEKFEEEAGRAGFALALLTPDDLVNAADAEYLQARPNVLFELGWFYGRLGRDRTCILWKRGGRLPSDLEGITRLEFLSSIDEAFLALERELRAAGIIR